MTTETTNPAAGSAAGGPTRAARRGEAVLYDFRRPQKLSREHVRALQIGYETFARQATTVITSTLRVVGEMTLVDVSQRTYDEYVRALPTPSFMGLLSTDPLPGTGVLTMDLPTVMATVDHLLGGPGGAAQPDRTPTDLEEQLLRRFLDRLLAELRYAFSSLVNWTPALTGVEYNPQFAQAASASDTMIAATFDLHLGDVESQVTICLPFAPLLPLLEAATGRAPQSSQQRLAREAAARAVTDRLTEVPMPVSVTVGNASLTADAILGLAVGDVVPLAHAVTAPLRVTAAGITFAHAVPGTNGKRLACLVVPDPHGADAR